MLRDYILNFEKFGFGWFVLVSFAALLVLVLVVLPVVFFFKDEQCVLLRKIRFFFTFGIWPEGERSEIGQKITTSKLEELANRYSSQDLAERHFNQQLQNLQGLKQLRDLKKEYLKCQRQLKKAKKEFWRAWRLADRYGYKVKERYANYLPLVH